MAVFLVTTAMEVVACPATATPQAAEITVTHRFSAAFCAGLCVDEIVNVHANGDVTWLLIDRSGEEIMVSPAHFYVGPIAVAAFLREMQGLKPTTSIKDLSGCKASRSRTDVVDWEIVWRRTSGRRLLTCDSDRRVLKHWWRALAALGMREGFAGGKSKNVRLIKPGRWRRAQAERH